MIGGKVKNKVLAMAKKKELTKEQKRDIGVLQANKEMLLKSLKDAEARGKDTESIQLAIDEVDKKMDLINPMHEEVEYRSAQKKAVKKATSIESLFDDDALDLLQFAEQKVAEKREMMKAEETKPKKAEGVREIQVEREAEVEETTYNDEDKTELGDVIQLPSNGECYPSKMKRVPVAYLTAADENLITSPNLYRDGLVIDLLLKNKVTNKNINVDELVSRRC